MRNKDKYLKIAQELFVGDKKRVDFRLVAHPLERWDLIPNFNVSYTETVDSKGKYIHDEEDDMLLSLPGSKKKNKKDKAKKVPQIPFFTYTYNNFSFLIFTLSWTTIERV